MSNDSVVTEVVKTVVADMVEVVANNTNPNNPCAIDSHKRQKKSLPVGPTRQQLQKNYSKPVLRLQDMIRAANFDATHRKSDLKLPNAFDALKERYERRRKARKTPPEK